MPRNQKRYKKFEHMITVLLSGSTVLFIAFLIASSLGVTWLKVLSSIVAIFICCLCLFMLLLARELFRRRSQWLSAWSAAVILCTLASLILNYPVPPIY